MKLISDFRARPRRRDDGKTTVNLCTLKDGSIQVVVHHRRLSSRTFAILR